MKKLYICITACLLSLNYSYSQSKEDISIYKGLYWDSSREKTIKKYPNNLVVKIYKLYNTTDEFFNPRSRNKKGLFTKYTYGKRYEVTDFSDLLSNIKSDLNFLKQRQNEIIKLKTFFEGRKNKEDLEKYSKKAARKRETNLYENFERGLNQMYLDTDEFDEIIKVYKKRLESVNISYSSKDLRELKDSDDVDHIGEPNFVFRYKFGKFLSTVNKSKNNADLIDNVLNEFSSFPINVKFVEDKWINDFYSYRSIFIDRIFINIQKIKKVEGPYYKNFEKGNTIDNTIENVLKVLNVSSSYFNDIESSEVVKILRSNDYKSPFIDLLDMEFKVHNFLFKGENYQHSLGEIYRNVFVFAYNYMPRFSMGENQYSEMDINTMKEISEYEYGVRELPNSHGRIGRNSSKSYYRYYDFVKNMTYLNERISNPKNCLSSTHKKTLIKTQLHTNYGRKPIYSKLISFDLISSSSCSYVWNIKFVDLSGGENLAKFRTKSDLSTKKIEIELWDFNKNRYMSPVSVSTVY